MVCVTFTTSFFGQYLMFSLQSTRHLLMWSTRLMKLNWDGHGPGLWISPKWHSLVSTQCEPLTKWYGWSGTQQDWEGTGAGAGWGVCAQVDPIWIAQKVMSYCTQCISKSSTKASSLTFEWDPKKLKKYAAKPNCAMTVTNSYYSCLIPAEI